MNLLPSQHREPKPLRVPLNQKIRNILRAQRNAEELLEYELGFKSSIHSKLADENFALRLQLTHAATRREFDQLTIAPLVPVPDVALTNRCACCSTVLEDDYRSDWIDAGEGAWFCSPNCETVHYAYGTWADYYATVH
jgi:hypothetical protein